MPQDPRDHEADDERSDSASDEEPSHGSSDDRGGLADLTADDIPDDLSGLIPLPSSDERDGPPSSGQADHPSSGQADHPSSDEPDRPPSSDEPDRPPSDEQEAAHGVTDEAPPTMPGAEAGLGEDAHRSAAVRVTARYIELRVATMDRDGGPGMVLRRSARAPLVSTLVLAVLVGAVLVMTFGVPPISPLFLIPVVCGPVYPWLRLEARAQHLWRDRPAP